VPGHTAGGPHLAPGRTGARHERLYLFSGDDVVDVWPADLRGW
jgi:D-serine deaminase-like pyridoxal phosphate-dependent protein